MMMENMNEMNGVIGRSGLLALVMMCYILRKQGKYGPGEYSTWFVCGTFGDVGFWPLGWSVELVVFQEAHTWDGRVLRLRGLFWDFVLIHVYSDKFKSWIKRKQDGAPRSVRIRSFLAPSYTLSPADQGE